MSEYNTICRSYTIARHQRKNAYDIFLYAYPNDYQLNINLSFLLHIRFSKLLQIWEIQFQKIGIFL